jgi:hypothetical protein
LQQSCALLGGWVGGWVGEGFVEVWLCNVCHQEASVAQAVSTVGTVFPRQSTSANCRHHPTHSTFNLCHHLLGSHKLLDLSCTPVTLVTGALSD